MSITRSISKAIYRMAGWHIGPIEGVETPRCVICVAPHTSNWDFPMGKLFYNAIGCNAGFLIKKEWFVFPLGYVFRWLGGVPVDRSRRGSSVTDQMVERFRTSERFQVAITPEGTRKPAKEWKKGFYLIAQKAEVPILLIYMDYAKKEIGSMGLFHPTGDADADIRAIRQKYRGVKACHPENFVEI